MPLQIFSGGTAVAEYRRKSKLAELYTGSSSFQALLCLDGEGYILTEDKEKLAYSKGNCIFIPANTGKLQLCGRSQFLKISC